MRYFGYFWFFFFLSNQALAENYHWKFKVSTYSHLSSSDPGNLCSQYVQYLNNNSSTNFVSYTVSDVIYSNLEYQVYCSPRYSNGSSNLNLWMYLYGDECPTGTFDFQKGVCQGSIYDCTQHQGQTAGKQWFPSNINSVVDSNNCEMVPVGVSICMLGNLGDTSTSGKCYSDMQYTGQSKPDGETTTTGQVTDIQPTQTTDVDVQKTSSTDSQTGETTTTVVTTTTTTTNYPVTKECKYIAGQYSCTAQDSTRYCGTVNNENICVSTDSGSGQVVDTTTTTEKTTNKSNGTIEKETTDTTVITKSDGTSSTGSTTTTQTQDTEGNTTAKRQTCSGISCNGQLDTQETTEIGVQDFYTGEDSLTMSSVLADFKTGVESAPFYSTATGFFDVSTTGAACPVFSGEIPIFGIITFDQHCSSVMEDIWPMIRLVLLACAAFLSFRIAFL